jgi:hypothetical protein
VIFFHVNKINSKASDVSDSDRITSISVKTWAGQPTADDEQPFFCLGNDGTEDKDILLYVTSNSLQLSANKRQWSPAINIFLSANKTSDAVYLRCIADLDVMEGDSQATIVADGSILEVDYFLAGINETDTDKSQAARFSGDNSREVREFFLTEGEALRILEWTPLPKPSCLSNPFKLQDLRNQSIQQWCNPNNRQVGWSLQEHYVKGFCGDREAITNRFYDPKNLGFTLNETNALILPHDFQGFDPTWQKTLIEFSQLTPFQKAYQGTVWTLLRDNTEYALRNIKTQRFFRGQVMMFSADLVRVHTPGGSASENFLPWNELLNEDWKVIDYVAGFADDLIEDPYSDPYCPYLGGIS